MEQPKAIQNTIKAIYLCIGLSVVALLLDRLTGRMGEGEFMFNLIFMGIFVMVPYKIARRSNPTRYVYTVITVIGVLIGIGSTTKLPLFTMISGVIQAPFIAATLYGYLVRKVMLGLTVKKLRSGMKKVNFNHLPKMEVFFLVLDV